MAKFTIYSPSGVPIYEGKPTFTGQYMKPGFLEFREVALPAFVELVPGCYVDYARTGHRYRIYTVPQVKKQARLLSYGGAFVYQSVQLYDASKMLEYCPFRDLVLGDNRIHFSTQPSISTFEGCDGLARRFEACLVDQYGANSWVVRIATSSENPELHDLMLEPRDFTVSGVNILECLDKIYEIWPGVGWIYKVEMANGSPVDTIVIGGIGTNSGSYQYSKGDGLTSITRVAANANEIANRIFAYGSSRNMLPRWYNSQNIKDAESVDIQNLMLPVGPVGTPDVPDYWPGWGETDGERDASKAFVENAASILKNGLRPATVYFDGSGEYPAIYPSIRETTIGMVRTAIGDSTAKYYPSTTIYTDQDARIDKLLSAQSTFDSGKAGADGKSSTDVGYIPYDHSGQLTPIQIAARSVHTEAFAFGTIALSGAGRLNIEVSYPGIGILTGCGAVYLDFTIGKVHSGATTTIYTQRVVMNPGDAGSYSIPEGRISYNGETLFESGDSLSVVVNLVLDNRTGADDTTAFLTNVSGTMTVKAYYHRDKTFTISLRQIGFDINEQSALGNGKTIAMRTGKCAGRSFAIKSVQYDTTTDSWALECWRTEDESLSQWFPNTDYPVRGLENAGQSNEYPGDEFVILDIAMPDIYVQMAEQKLLTAAQELLADTAVERWQYSPEIDAKFMVENNRSINAGEYLLLSDTDIIGVSAESVFVDSVTINEGESAIPTYKVTLRDRKKKTWTESQSPDSPSNKSVGSITNESTQQRSSSVGDSFFQLDESGNVTLKPKYQNLWVPGWLAAGGIGRGGGGGGGGGLISSVKGVADLNTPIVAESLTETFSSKAIQTIWDAVKVLQNTTPNVSLVNGANYSALTVNGTTADFYTKGQVDTLLANIDLDGYVTEEALETELAGINVLADITTSQDGTVNFIWHNGDVVKVDLNHQHSNYVEITRTINGHSLSDNVVLSAVTDLGVAEWAIGGGGSTIPFNRLPSMYVAGARVYDGRERVALITVEAISHELSSGSGDQSRIVWEPNAGGQGIGAWHFLGNVYADGWISAGGIGSGGSAEVSYLKYLTDVYHGSNGVLRADGTAVQSGDALVYLNASTGWVASPVSGGGGGGADLPAVWDSLTNTVADAYANTQIDLAHIPNVTTAKITDLETWIAGKGYALSSAIPTSLSQLSGDSTHRLVTDSQINSWGAKSTVSISNVLPQATGRTRVATITIDGNNYDIFSPEASGGSVSTETDPIFSASAAFGITAQNIASWNAKSDFSGSYNDLTDKPTIPSAQVNADWNASSGVSQILNKPSSLPASDVSSWAKAANKPSYSLSEISGTDDLRAIEVLAGTAGILKKTAANTWSLDTTTYLASGATLDDIADGTTRKLSNYLPLVGGTMTGHITMSGASLLSSADSANSIGASDKRFNQAFIRNIYTTYLAFRSDDGQSQRGTFGIGDGNATINIVGSPNNTSYNFYAGSGFFHGGNGEVPCGRSDHRWSKMWSIDADLSGHLALASTSHIDIGPVRIEYDQQNDAIHITTNDSTNHPTIGIYADGIVAAGGVGQTS